MTHSLQTTKYQAVYIQCTMPYDCKNIKTAFGDKIRSIRLSKDLSQEKLAELADLDRTYISGVERGVRNISLVNICQLAKALEIDIKKLFD